ncbi:RING domain-containing protein [Cryptosporidium felis]|nr:RING domain-containing protein [Cryptosporidium felis]
MSVTLGSILFPERRKVAVDTKKGVHSKRKKQVNTQKNQEQTSRQFTTRLLLDDETISPNDFLTPFPSDDIRNTEQFWEYLERVFYPIDERWVNILDLSARPRSAEPRETCIGLHFAYRWALVDLFDTDELFKLVGGKEKIFCKDQFEEPTRGSGIDETHCSEKADSVVSGGGLADSSLYDHMVLSYLEFLDLPSLELIGIHQGMTQGGLDQIVVPANPYFEEWKFLHQRLCYVEKEVDKMVERLSKCISENVCRDNSRKLLQRHQKKKCGKFLLKVMHHHSVRQFVDSLEEVLYFDEETGKYLTTWDDGEAVRASWISQDQLLQLLLFRPGSTESKYSVSIPTEYISYAKSLDTCWFKYLLDSGIPMINDASSSSQDDNRLGDTLNLDSPRKPKGGCIELSRHPFCHYCRRSCEKLNYSRCPSKLKPLNFGFNPSFGLPLHGGNAHGQIQNLNTQTVFSCGTGLKPPGLTSSTSSSNVYYSRSLVPWRVPKLQDNTENSNHSEANVTGIPNCKHKHFYEKPNNALNIKREEGTGLYTVGTTIPGACFGSKSPHMLNLNGTHVCSVCTDFEASMLSESLKNDEEILVSRAYSPNNCWRMYCSECIMHNFSSVIKQKYSNGVVLRYYCPFCSGTCNCERCLRNQQIRKIRNYLKSRFSGFLSQCSITSYIVGKEITWFDFLRNYGGNDELFPTEQDSKDVCAKVGTRAPELSFLNEDGEVDESLITLKNVAYTSYINNVTQRFSVSENTHLGFIWLQANNIPFQKPSPNNTQTGSYSNDQNIKQGLSNSSNTGISTDPSRSACRNKSRSTRLSVGSGTQRQKKHSVVMGTGEQDEATSIQSNKFNSELLPSAATGTSHSFVPGYGKTQSSFCGRQGNSQGFPPSIHVPREVASEPTNASGASVLWSLRSILINNVNRYHRECLWNLERWEAIQELYSSKRVELESHFEELQSKLSIMDEWIRSISFTETNKRLIMRKMPLLCWTANIPSAKAFSFDDFPQLAPTENVVEALKHIRNFVEYGILPEYFPEHPTLRDSELRQSEETPNTSQKTTPMAKSSEGGGRLSDLTTPASIMEFLINAIPQIQNIVVKTNQNSSKDEMGKTSKAQRGSKKDRGSLNKNPQGSAKSGNGENPEERASSAAVDSTSINAELLNGIQETSPATYVGDQGFPQFVPGVSVGGEIQGGDSEGGDAPSFIFEDTLSSSATCGSFSQVDPSQLDRGGSCYSGSSTGVTGTASKTVPRGDSNFEFAQQRPRKRRSSVDSSSNGIPTSEKKKETSVKRRREKEDSAKRVVKRSNSGLSFGSRGDSVYTNNNYYDSSDDFEDCQVEEDDANFSLSSHASSNFCSRMEASGDIFSNGSGRI